MKWFMLLSLSLFISCGKKSGDGSDGISGNIVAPIIPMISSFDFQDVPPGLVCSEGGVSLIIFTDKNNDGIFQDNETITKSKTLCNGRIETLSYESFSASLQCPQGGIKISSSSNVSGVEVCHGKDGADGAKGQDGRDGIDGKDASDGQTILTGNLITPIKFCSREGQPFSEYGLLINDELFAVYWDASTGSAKKSDAYLTRLELDQFINKVEENCLMEAD